MLSGDQRDHRASLGFVGVLAQRVGQGGNEARIGVTQHEQKLGRALQGRVRDARVVERPLDELVDEIMLERSERRALGAREHDHDRRSVLQAVVEQLSRKRVVLGGGSQLAHVFGAAQGAHARPRPPHQLLHQLRLNGGVEQLVFAAEVFVQVADGGAGPRGHVGHGGFVVTQLGEGAGRSRHERVANLRLAHLHLKEN